MPEVSRSRPPHGLHLRWPGHALALGLVGVLLAATALISPRSAPASAQTADGGPLTTNAPLQLADQPLAATTATAWPASVEQNPASLPTWLAASTDTYLWASPVAGSDARRALTAGTAVKALGSISGQYTLAYFPGDDQGQGAGQGWVDLTSMQPGSRPAWIVPDLATGAPGLPAPPTRISDADPPLVTSLHVAIVDEDSGQMIYSDAPYDHVPEASVTKMATTIVALERVPDLSKQITATVSASAMAAADGSSTMGIEPGDSVSIQTLLYGMMLPSGNDAAEQIALTVGGTRDTYIGWMNDEAVALGLQDTHFMNPSGMDQDGHYTSAYDMAMLARYAMRNSMFRKLASTITYRGDDYVMTNANHLLGVYPGTDGVKIGYTDNAQRTYVASATHNGHRVYVSLMHAVDKDGDAEKLFDWVWRTFSWS